MTEQVDPSNVHNIQIYKALDGWRWRALAHNGEIVAEGESYTRLSDAYRAVESIFPDVESVTEVLQEDPNAQST
jgi:uncharacterized protein YegP (UPF0339 family)